MKWWNQLWFSRFDPLPAAVCRIGIGLLLTFMFVALAPNWERFYGHDGILSLGEADLNSQRPADWWCLFVWTEDYVPLAAWWWVGLVAAICLATGLLTRVATITLYVLVSSLIHRNNYIVNGEELVLRMMLFYGCFSPWGQALSVDAWLQRQRRRAAGKTLVEIQQPLIWSIRLMQINFLLIYAISVPYKFAQDLDWLWGDALHWTVASDSWWMRGFLPELTLAFGGAIRKSLTWGTIVLEATFPILVWFRKPKLVVIAAIASLHLGIALLIPGVTLFTLSMVCGALLFVPAETYQWAAAKIKSQVLTWMTGPATPAPSLPLPTQSQLTA